jgi:hypothetical protein
MRTGTGVQQVTPPAGTSTVSTLGRVDYEDAFVVDVETPHALSAEQWIRRVLEEAPTTLRLQLLSGWSGLGLALKRPGAAGSVLGWQIRAAEPDFVLLGAASRVGMPAELYLRRETDRLLFCTLVRHENPLVRALWARVIPTHVRTVRALLARAGSS